MVAELIDFAVHVKGLGFREKPDYSYLRKCLQSHISSEEFSPDWVGIPRDENLRIRIFKQWLL